MIRLSTGDRLGTCYATRLYSNMIWASSCFLQWPSTVRSDCFPCSSCTWRILRTKGTPVRTSLYPVRNPVRWKIAHSVILLTKVLLIGINNESRKLCNSRLFRVNVILSIYTRVFTRIIVWTCSSMPSGNCICFTSKKYIKSLFDHVAAEFDVSTPVPLNIILDVAIASKIRFLSIKRLVGGGGLLFGFGTINVRLYIVSLWFQKYFGIYFFPQLSIWSFIFCFYIDNIYLVTQKCQTYMIQVSSWVIFESKNKSLT